MDERLQDYLFELKDQFDEFKLYKSDRNAWEQEVSLNAMKLMNKLDKFTSEIEEEFYIQPSKYSESAYNNSVKAEYATDYKIMKDLRNFNWLKIIIQNTCKTISRIYEEKPNEFGKHLIEDYFDESDPNNWGYANKQDLQLMVKPKEIVANQPKILNFNKPLIILNLIDYDLEVEEEHNKKLRHATQAFHEMTDLWSQMAQASDQHAEKLKELNAEMEKARLESEKVIEEIIVKARNEWGWFGATSTVTIGGIGGVIGGLLGAAPGFVIGSSAGSVTAYIVSKAIKDTIYDNIDKVVYSKVIEIDDDEFVVLSI